MAGIYIHIPFCKQACSYCDFYFVTQQKLRNSFVEGLLQEIKSYRDSTFTNESVRTIYIGGGTPSLLPVEQLGAILDALAETFTFEAEEVTLEMNPDDVTADYLTGLKQANVNRASMGVQSFQPDLLSFMNRAHNSEEALACLELLSASGFEAFTVDLIYGNPNQRLQQLSDDLDLLLKFSPPHISAYSLTIEPGTRLGKQVQLGRISPPKEGAVADQFEFINKRLAEEGIERYEVSNYSRPGREAKHNSNYWRHRNYLGFGPGAHSFWWDEHPRRWSNKADIQAYLKEPGGEQKTETLSMQQLSEERIMMGLRTRAGIAEQEMTNTYDYTFSDKQKAYLLQQQKQGRLEWDDRIRLTDSGILIADTITLDLLTM